MSSVEQARTLALALPGAVERDHHGRPSFRVDGRIFATLWDGEHMNVMVDEGGIRTHVGRDPRVYAEVWWGKRLAAVRVALALVGERELGELLADAWESKAGSARAG
ncbi:MAG TPA: MmcQ/YjbR family DNA-binding protein [Solirubrobacteraceae bacterium]|nr:MmcQ/YjbR family DNA-binding protein [Solirubrobacteraceae bacterium]